MNEGPGPGNLKLVIHGNQWRQTVVIGEFNC